MNAHTKIAGLLLVAVAFVAAAYGASVERPRLFDRSVARIHSGVSDVDVSEADYTGYVTWLTIEPASGHALFDAEITIDLDTGDGANGFAGAHSSSETIQFAVARKIQGLWRIDDELETATVAEGSAGDRCVTLRIGNVGPTEDVRVYVRLSAEAGDFGCAYVLSYRAGADATLTEVAN